MHQTISFHLPRCVFGSSGPTDNLHQIVESLNCNIAPAVAYCKKIYDADEMTEVGLMYKTFDPRTQKIFLTMRNLGAYFQKSLEDVTAMERVVESQQFRFIKSDLPSLPDTPELDDFESYLMAIETDPNEFPTVWGQLIVNKRFDTAIVACSSFPEEIPVLSDESINSLVIKEFSTRNWQFVSEAASDWLIEAYNRAPEKVANQFFENLTKYGEYCTMQSSAEKRAP